MPSPLTPWSRWACTCTFSWEAKDANTVALTFEGDTADATLEGDELVLSVDGSSLKFKKGEIPADALAAGDTSADEAGQAAE